MDTLFSLLIVLALIGTVLSVLRSPGLWYAAALVLTFAGLLGPAILCLVIGFVTHLATAPHGTD